ncbi:hypothetical protein B6I21_05725, partial [candidate division KSB1 bacterium 4572_119]
MKKVIKQLVKLNIKWLMPILILLVLDPRSLTSQVIEVEDMAIKTTGYAISGGWVLDSEGYVADTFDFLTENYYSFKILAKGTKSGSEWPFMELSVENLQSGPVIVDKTYWREYTV